MAESATGPLAEPVLIEKPIAISHVERGCLRACAGTQRQALNVIICDAGIPAYKRKYLEKSGSLCPFCEGSDLSSGPIQADGPVAWAEVECEDCGASWRDVWALADISRECSPPRQS